MQYTIYSLVSVVFSSLLWQSLKVPIHCWRIGQFKKEYPDAKLIAVEEAIQKKKKEGLTFDGCT